MKLFGLLLIVLGVALRWFISINSVISWVLIIIGVIIVIAGYLLESKAS